MKVDARKLASHLEGRLASAYLVAGDEPLLVGEALAQIRAAARRSGFDERELNVVDRSFRWSELESASDNLSLFAARRVVEIRLASPRPGDGSQVIANLAERPDPDRLLVVGVNAKLDASAQRSKWVKAIEQHGVRVDVWPVERAELPRWIAARAASLDLRLDPPAAELLADRVEGNLLAADQELRKLALTAAGRRIGEDTILESVANSARFDVFRLTDAIVAGDARRALRALYALKAEGVAPALVSWALNREIALLTRLKFAVGNGENAGNAMARHGVWRRRQPAVKAALDRYAWPELDELMARAAKLDDTIKGIAPGRPWDALTSFVLATLDTRRLGARPAA